MTGGLSIGDAARRLRVSVQALRAWTRRYGYPPSWRTRGGHRRFPLADIDRLAICLEKNQWDVRTAIAEARNSADAHLVCPHCRRRIGLLLK